LLFAFYLRRRNSELCGDVGAVDEARKHALLFAATLLAARTLAKYEYRACPATEAAIANGIIWAEKLLKRIEEMPPRS
jgi:hypothetical protein